MNHCLLKSTEDMHHREPHRNVHAIHNNKACAKGKYAKSQGDTCHIHLSVWQIWHLSIPIICQEE